MSQEIPAELPPAAMDLLRDILGVGGDDEPPAEEPGQEPTEPGSGSTPAARPSSSGRIDPEALERLRGAISVDDFERVDLHVVDEDLATVLKLLSLEARRNIVVSDGVASRISADLYRVGFYDTLDALLTANGLVWDERGGFIHVRTEEEAEARDRSDNPIVARVIELQYLNAADARAFAAPLLSEEGSVETPSPPTAFEIPDEAPVGKDDYASDSVLVIYDYPERIEAIETLLARLDSKPTQVLIEATILQVTLNEANAFGVDFSVLARLDFGDFASTLGGVDTLQSTGAPGGTGRVASSTVGGTGAGGGFRVGVIDGDVAVFLRALDEVTDVSMVSKPKLLTLNRQAARVLVGTRVGYLNSTTTTETATVQEVDFLNTGTQLRVRPFVMRDGHIRLELKPQVSSATLRSSVGPGGGSITIPDEDTTELVTNLLVRDGQTVVLGGLFSESTTTTRRQVPLLGDIPLLGAAFRGQEDEVRRSEILFLIRPVIMSDEQMTRAGRQAEREIERVRVGSRRGLLPFSREKRVSRLLIDAERLVGEGEREHALWKIERAMELSPQSPDAIAARDRLVNRQSVAPERSILESVLAAHRKRDREVTRADDR